jgi:hypothetical protein
MLLVSGACTFDCVHRKGCTVLGVLFGMLLTMMLSGIG